MSSLDQQLSDYTELTATYRSQLKASHPSIEPTDHEIMQGLIALSQHEPIINHLFYRIFNQRNKNS